MTGDQVLRGMIPNMGTAPSLYSTLLTNKILELYIPIEGQGLGTAN